MSGSGACSDIAPFQLASRSSACCRWASGVPAAAAASLYQRSRAISGRSVRAASDTMSVWISMKLSSVWNSRAPSSHDARAMRKVSPQSKLR